MNIFSKYGLFVLLYNLFEILWGAFVREIGSGAGCGSHWRFSFPITRSKRGNYSLGDTIFPVNSLEEGLKQEFSMDSHILLWLSIYHPLVAVLASGITFMFVYFAKGENSHYSGIIINSLYWMIIIQLVVGFVNVILLAPIGIQITHLLFACIVWIFFVLFFASLYSQYEGLSYNDPIAS